MPVGTVTGKKLDKDEIDHTFGKKSGNFPSKTEESKTFQTPKKFLRKVRVTIPHGKDVTELMTAVKAFVSWIYEHDFRRMSLFLVPKETQEILHPQILGGLLYVFGKRKRQKVQPPPAIRIYQKWIKVDWESKCICISEIYRTRKWDLILPLPDNVPANTEAILWVKVDATKVEYVFGTSMEMMIDATEKGLQGI
ncbi:MAG: hypothetical protein M0Q91_15075 [Methanoregula sp.]|jgi:hypothetical protein|nr:hypothetical protein [Methanoregula sp.]